VGGSQILEEAVEEQDGGRSWRYFGG